MATEKIRASRAHVYPAPEGAKGDGQIHVYTYDVFNDTFLPGKSFENVERAVQHQRHEQERIFVEQEAEPELFDLPFLSHDPALLEHVQSNAEYRRGLKRDLTSDARSRGRRR